MNILGACSFVLTFSLTLIGTNADKNPTGQPLGYFPSYPTYPQSYWHKPASYYRKCVPKDTSLDVTVLPDRNQGRPFHSCRYRIATLEGLFYRDNGTYFPCKPPKVLNVLRVGETLPEILQVMKGAQETIAVKFPLPIPEATADRPTSVPVAGGIVTEAFIFLKNTSVPHIWHKDEDFHKALQEKIRIIKENARPYRETQLELIMSLHDGMSNSVANAELHIQNRNQNRHPNDRREAGAFIVTDIQSFATPTTRAIEEIIAEDRKEDHTKAEDTFGLAGARFEFQQTSKVADRIIKLANHSVEEIDAGDFGNIPQDASRNVVNMHQSFLDLARRSQNDLDINLSNQASQILANSHFDFKVSSTVEIPFCSEDTEVDPDGLNVAGNVNGQSGTGRAKSRK